jgi:hypothetical protein
MIDVFKPIERDVSINGYEMIELSPSGSSQGKNLISFQLPSYEFSITDLMNWYALHEGYLQCNFQIIDGTTNVVFQNGDLISFVNNCYNLFKRVSYQQNNITVEEREFPGIVEQITGLMHHSPESEITLNEELWSPDRGSGQFDFNQSNPSISVADHLMQFSHDAGATWTDTTGAQFIIKEDVDGDMLLQFNNAAVDNDLARVKPHAVTINSTLENPLYNKGLATRIGKMRPNPTGTYAKQYSVRIPLRRLFKYFDFNRFLMKGIEHKFKLYVNEQNRMMFRTADGANHDGRLMFTYMCLWIPKITIAKKFNDQLTQQMSQGMSKSIGWNKYSYHLRDLPIARTERNVKWTIPISESKPRKVYAFIQRADAATSQLINTMIFPAQPVSKAFVRFNGNVIPEYTYDLVSLASVNQDVPATANAVNFPHDRSFLRLYEEFLRVGNKQFSTLPPCITYEEFVQLYFIMVFDLSKIDEDKVYTGITKANLDLDISFDSDLSEKYPVFNGGAAAAGVQPTDVAMTFNLHCVIEYETTMTLGSNSQRLVPMAI